VFEHAKVVNRIGKSKKNRQHNGQKKRQTIFYKTPHRKLKTEQQRNPFKTGVYSGATEG
jgi:hypothetical protein